ncbi:MAG: FdhD protein [Kiritimatiellia bacterium]|jgi:FdhD protein
MNDAMVQRRTVVRYPHDNPVSDHLVVEEPMELRVEGQPLAITMRTPGHDLELAAGFLYGEGVIDGLDDLVAMRHVDDPSAPQGNTVDCLLAGGVQAHREAITRATRELYATSSCGVCGKASIDRLHIMTEPVVRGTAPRTSVLLGLNKTLRSMQLEFERTGGLHAAALVDMDGRVEVLREDIGRHNAVDKVVGWRLRQGRVPVDDRMLVVSSRAGFEIIQKALIARVPVVVAMGAASTLAVDLAARSGLRLYGFLRDDRYTVYT